MRKNQVTGALLSGGMALIGTLIGANLTRMHVRSASGYDANSGVCDALSKTGCEIALSESGMFLGLPISLIGMGGGLAIVLCIAASFFGSVRSEGENRFLVLVWGLGLVSVIASVAMAIVSLIDGRFCPLCVGWYGANAGVLIGVWWALGGTLSTRLRVTFQSAFSGVGIALGLGFMAFLLGANLWIDGAIASGLEQRAESLKAQRELIEKELAAHDPKDVPAFPDLPLKVAGNPEGPLIRIVEISDIECPFCKKLWQNLDAFMETTDARVEVQFLHYPLDSECNPRIKSRLHEAACFAAKAAICAQKQGKFWEFTGEAFENQRDLEPADLERVAKRLDMNQEAYTACLENPGTHERLQSDIRRAIELGVKGTPTLFVNGYQLSGALSPEAFQLMADVAGIPPGKE